MRKFLEKSFILIFCLYHSYLLPSTLDIHFLFLISLLISLLLDLLYNTKYRYLIYIFYIFISFWNNSFLIYLPLILYNGYLDFRQYIVIASPLLLINFSPLNLILSVIAPYISTASKQYDTLKKGNKTTRDSLIENALYLQKYNEQLEVDKEKNIQIAILTERNRIARELHDSIGHSISSGILQAEALKMITKEEKTIENLNILQDTLKNGMEDIRKNIHNLYNESFDLKGKIYDLVENIPELDMDLSYYLSEDLSYELKFDILSIIKEAVTNYVKHSNGDQLKINLLEQPSFYSVSIKDNGSKYDFNENILYKGMGLSSMKEIANKYNGFLNHSFDQGFKIHITLMKEQV